MPESFPQLKIKPAQIWGNPFFVFSSKTSLLRNFSSFEFRSFNDVGSGKRVASEPKPRPTPLPPSWNQEINLITDTRLYRFFAYVKCWIERRLRPSKALDIMPIKSWSGSHRRSFYDYEAEKPCVVSLSYHLDLIRPKLLYNSSYVWSNLPDFELNWPHLSWF